MGIGSSWSRMAVTVALLLLLGVMCWGKGIHAIRFVIDREECLSQNVEYDGDTLQLSFVVIAPDTPWHYYTTEPSLHLLIKGPSGEPVHEFRDKSSEMYEFRAQRKGVYQFCFTNNSPYHEYMDFDLHVSHFTHYNQPAKDEHFDPLLEHISKLEEALQKIQVEQHWLEAQTERQASVNEGMGRRAMTKAIVESIALFLVTELQSFLLRRLFEKKL
ncbi:transmembrane emp24 domain-containing protein p24beta2 [Nicotiana tabacum]|uniref:Transmembrane emp24 domain-containing protein p24beta2 n=1 Tax=Nicotiana tabacum TaxID=4097 RepID=A0A1S3XIK3_TOBAC|nr:PREDICTED: transmembrane emp24 domain-containing protein p24beta2-like [Nicotiana tabacum]